jgi:parallel beta-helix repeat protein
MNRPRLSGNVMRPFFVLLTIATLILGIQSPSRAATICVNPNNKSCAATIGFAVAVAQPGDKITVAAGTYKEEVVINKPLTLAGTGDHGKSTFIDATGLVHGIYITGLTSGRLIISQFTVENAMREGVLLENSTNITLADDTILNNDKSIAFTTPPCSQGTAPCCPGAFPFEQQDCGEGVHLLGTTNSTIANNVVQGNQGGILLSDETGATSNNLITNNLVQNNLTDCGITLPSHPPCGQGSNDVNGCVGGAQIGTASPGVFANSVIGNTSIGNGGAGTGVFAPTPGTAAYGNLIANNVLKNNGEPGIALHSHAPSQNLNGNVIVGNLISGNGPEPGEPSTIGISLFSDQSMNAAPFAATVYQNTISHQDIDVFVGTEPNNVGIFYNNLTGPELGILNAGGGTLNAPLNFWGCPNGPNDAACSHVSGTVLFPPSLQRPFDPRSLNRKIKPSID